MAGHSQFKNIMYRKGAQDAKRARQFAKLIREITAGARAGVAEPAANPRLRAAVALAREANMPKETIERAISKAAGAAGAEDYAEVRYEGYGPGGTAVIVEALTDNRNRTAAELRAAFAKAGGSLGETNSVSFQFERRGVIRYGLERASPEALLEAAIEAGAENLETTAEANEVLCAPEEFFPVRDALEARLGPPDSARLEWRPRTRVMLEEEKASALLRLLEALDENDDVQNVYDNAELPESVIGKLSA